MEELQCELQGRTTRQNYEAELQGRTTRQNYSENHTDSASLAETPSALCHHHKKQEEVQETGRGTRRDRKMFKGNSRGQIRGGI